MGGGGRRVFCERCCYGDRYREKSGWQELVPAQKTPTLMFCFLGNPTSLRPFFYLSRNRSFGCIAQRQGQGDVSIPQKRQPYFPAIHASLGAGLQLLAFSEEGANREEGEKGTDLIGQGQKRLGRFTHLRDEVQDSLQLRRLVVSANLRAGTVPG